MNGIGIRGTKGSGEVGIFQYIEGIRGAKSVGRVRGIGVSKALEFQRHRVRGVVAETSCQRRRVRGVASEALAASVAAKAAGKQNRHPQESEPTVSANRARRGTRAIDLPPSPHPVLLNVLRSLIPQR